MDVRISRTFESLVTGLARLDCIENMKKLNVSSKSVPQIIADSGIKKIS